MNYERMVFELVLKIVDLLKKRFQFQFGFTMITHQRVET